MKCSVHVSSNLSGHDFFCESMRILNEADIPFLVGGAFALCSYTGVARDTKDFDIMVDERDVPRTLQTFRDKGFRADLTFPHWLAKVHHGETFIDVIFNSGNGICPVDERWFQNARPAEIFGMEVLLCPVEEIIWQKAYIMERERFDGADVVHLLRSCAAKLDWPRLLERFDEDWRVLLTHLVLFGFIYPSRRSMIPTGVMNELLARLAHQVLSPDSETEEKLCFGTFLSRAQYLPDIERWGFHDPRLSDRTSMTPEQLQHWTNAIDSPPGHG